MPATFSELMPGELQLRGEEDSDMDGSDEFGSLKGGFYSASDYGSLVRIVCGCDW